MNAGASIAQPYRVNLSMISRCAKIIDRSQERRKAMGDIIDLRGRLIPIEDDELIENLARFADGTLSEAAVKSRNQGTTSTMKIGRPRARRTTSDGRRSKNVGLRRRKRVRQRVSVRTRRVCDAELPSIASLTTVQLPGCGMLHRRALYLSRSVSCL